MNVFYSPQRANIIRVTLPRRYSAQDLRRRNLVTMSRVRDGTSPTVRDAAKYPHVRSRFDANELARIITCH